jgi:hypothetical protein
MEDTNRASLFSIKGAEGIVEEGRICAAKYVSVM